MSIDEGACAGPQRREGPRVVEDVHIETVFHVVVTHESEYIVIDVTEEVDLLHVSITVLQIQAALFTSGSTRQYQSKSLRRGCL